MVGTSCDDDGATSSNGSSCGRRSKGKAAESWSADLSPAGRCDGSCEDVGIIGLGSGIQMEVGCLEVRVLNPESMLTTGAAVKMQVAAAAALLSPCREVSEPGREPNGCTWKLARRRSERTPLLPEVALGVAIAAAETVTAKLPLPPFASRTAASIPEAACGAVRSDVANAIARLVGVAPPDTGLLAPSAEHDSIADVKLVLQAGDTSARVLYERDGGALDRRTFPDAVTPPLLSISVQVGTSS